MKIAAKVREVNSLTSPLSVFHTVNGSLPSIFASHCAFLYFETPRESVLGPWSMIRRGCTSRCKSTSPKPFGGELPLKFHNAWLLVSGFISGSLCEKMFASMCGKSAVATGLF